VSTQEPGDEGAAPITADAPFEELQRELDAIVDRLERGEIAVDEAIALWQRGEALYRACSARLDAAELRVEELGRDGVSPAGDTPDDTTATTL
jgi:exodeoxyribonuclease VII small subunit